MGLKEYGTTDGSRLMRSIRTALVNMMFIGDSQQRQQHDRCLENDKAKNPSISPPSSCPLLGEA